MSSVRIALTASLTLLVIAIGLTLLHAPMSVARSNGVSPEDRIAATRGSANYCQADELLPAGTSKIRVTLSAAAGPHLNVVVSSAGSTVTTGQRRSGWTSRVVTIPVKKVPNAVRGATICVSFRLKNEGLTVFGEPTPPSIAARNGQTPLLGRMRIEYLRSGTRSWASIAPSIAHNMGLGRAASGKLIVFVALALLAGVVALASNLLLKDLR
jgi:hypothetical protein